MEQKLSEFWSFLESYDPECSDAVFCEFCDTMEETWKQLHSEFPELDAQAFLKEVQDSCIDLDVSNELNNIERIYCSTLVASESEYLTVPLNEPMDDELCEMKQQLESLQKEIDDLNDEIKELMNQKEEIEKNVETMSENIKNAKNETEKNLKEIQRLDREIFIYQQMLEPDEAVKYLWKDLLTSDKLKNDEQRSELERNFDSFNETELKGFTACSNLGTPMLHVDPSEPVAKGDYLRIEDKDGIDQYLSEAAGEFARNYTAHNFKEQEVMAKHLMYRLCGVLLQHMKAESRIKNRKAGLKIWIKNDMLLQVSYFEVQIIFLVVFRLFDEREDKTMPFQQDELLPLLEDHNMRKGCLFFACLFCMILLGEYDVKRADVVDEKMRSTCVEEYSLNGFINRTLQLFDSDMQTEADWICTCCNETWQMYRWIDFKKSNGIFDRFNRRNR